MLQAPAAVILPKPRDAVSDRFINGLVRLLQSRKHISEPTRGAAYALPLAIEFIAFSEFKDFSDGLLTS